MVRHGTRLEQLARNRYAVPVTIHWTMGAFDNVAPLSPIEGTVVLPAASAPLGAGDPVAINASAQGSGTSPDFLDDRRANFFQVMTVAGDGITKRSFPFELAVGPRRASAPVRGQRYAACRSRNHDRS